MTMRDWPPGRTSRGDPRCPGDRLPTPAAATHRESVLSVDDRARRELEAWGAAVLHLHALGLPAAVPEFPAAWLARRGVRADWAVAA